MKIRNLLATTSILGLSVLVACTPVATVPPTATSEPAPTATVAPTATPVPTATATPEPTATPVPEPTATQPSSIAVAAPSVGLLAPVAEADPETRRILDQAAEAMAELSSFHFDLNASILGDSGASSGEIPLSFVGDYQAPDRMHGEMTISLGFFEFNLETITIGETSYITNPQTGEWESVPGQSTGFPNPAELAGLESSALDGLTLIGEDVLDGVPVFRLQGTPPSDAFGTTEGGKVVAEFWIGTEDYLFRKITASGEIVLDGGINPLAGQVAGDLSDETATLDLTITFSSFNEPIEIEAPEL